MNPIDLALKALPAGNASRFAKLRRIQRISGWALTIMVLLFVFAFVALGRFYVYTRSEMSGSLLQNLVIYAVITGILMIVVAVIYAVVSVRLARWLASEFYGELLAVAKDKFALDLTVQDGMKIWTNFLEAGMGERDNNYVHLAGAPGVSGRYDGGEFATGLQILK